MGLVILQSSLNTDSDPFPCRRRLTKQHSVERQQSETSGFVTGREGEWSEKSSLMDWVMLLPGRLNHRRNSVRREADGFSIVLFGIPGR